MPPATPSVRYFSCGSCDLTFPQGWQARDEHCKQAKHRQPQFECARCSLYFISQNEVDLHMEAANHFPHVCRFCGQSWPIEEQCEEHETEEHLNAEHTHEEQADEEQANEEHTNEEHANGVSTGDKSLAELANEAAAALEQLTLQSRNITKTIATLSTAVKGPAPQTCAHPKKKKLACSHCRHTFTTAEGRDQHEKACHNQSQRNQQRRRICKECDMVFETKGKLRRHYLDAPDHGATCPYCKRRWGRASHLSSHLECGMCPNARHLNYFGLYRYIRLKDPLEKLAIQLPDWDCIKRVGNDRPFFYHCPNNGCNKKFRTFVGVITHIENGRRSNCKFKATYKEVQKLVPEKLLSGFKILHEI